MRFAFLFFIFATTATTWQVVALSDQELIACFQRLFEFHNMKGWKSLDLEAAVQPLNAHAPKMWDDYCGEARKFGSNNFIGQSVRTRTSDVLRKANEHSRALSSVNLFATAYPGSADVSTLYGTPVPFIEYTVSLPDLGPPPTVPSIDFTEAGFTDVNERITGDNGLADRCDTALEADDTFTLFLYKQANEVAQGFCSINGDTVTCFLAMITAVNLAWWELLIDGCALQDGLVDGAEIEATYENLISLIECEQENFEFIKNQFENLGQGGSVSTDIEARFAHLDNRLDTIDETLRMIRRMLLTRPDARPGYMDKFSKCDCSPGLIGLSCDESVNCPLPEAFP